VSATNTNTTANQQIIGTHDGHQKTSKKKMDTLSSFTNTAIIEGKIDTNNNSDSKANSDTTITDPQETDVLCGLGAGIYRHPGNVAFRRLVDEYKERYTHCQNKKNKTCISESIVEIIRKQNGRFLKRSTNRKFWMEIGDKKAIVKTSQRLREGQAEFLQQIMANKKTINNTCSQTTLQEDQSKQKTLSDQHVRTSDPLVQQQQQQQQQQYGNEPQSQSRQLQSASSSSCRLNININPAPAPAPLTLLLPMQLSHPPPPLPPPPPPMVHQQLQQQQHPPQNYLSTNLPPFQHHHHHYHHYIGPATPQQHSYQQEVVTIEQKTVKKEF